MATIHDQTGRRDEQPASHAGLSRRALLSVAAAAPLLLATRSAFAQSAGAATAPIDAAGFQALSVAVIGTKAGDRVLSDAYHAAFAEADPSFLARAASLAAAMKTAGLSTPEAFSASKLAQDEVSRATALGLTAAWYIGHVGQDSAHGKVVAYEAALMWAPTSDIMTIPSYARGGPDYWSDQIPQIEKTAPSL